MVLLDTTTYVLVEIQKLIFNYTLLSEGLQGRRYLTGIFPFLQVTFVLVHIEIASHMSFQYLHFQSNPSVNLYIFATVYSLMNDINLIDSCQAHLPMQYASNIEFIPQK